MDKRKCGAYVPSSSSYPPSPPPDLPCPSGINVVSIEKSPRLPIDTSLVNTLSSMAHTMENIPAKQSNFHISHGYRHSNPSRAMFLKRSHHHYKNHFSRQNFAGHRTGYHKGKYSTERGEKDAFRPEMIMSNSSVLSVVPSEATKMACGICGKSLEWSNVVAVLVCEHTYHAECLEKTTRLDYIRDPPCPACSKANPA